MTRRMLMASMWCGCTSDSTHVPLNSVSLEWFFTNASILLWADKILVTANDFSALHLQPYFNDAVDQECARILFDRLRDEGIVETFDPDTYLNPITIESIQEQVSEDEAKWGGDPPHVCDEGRPDLNTIGIAGRYYCPPMIEGVYGSLTLGRFLDCSCVFDQRQRQFLEDRFSGLGGFPEAGSLGLAVFSDLYQVVLPGLLPERDFMLFCDPIRGSMCRKAEECRRDSKQRLSRLIEYVLVARERPDLKQMACRLDQLESEVGPDNTRIRRALIRDLRREQRNVLQAYPAAKHWARITQTASTALALYGSQGSHPVILMSAGAIAGLAQLVHSSVTAIQEKRRWLLLLAEKITTPVRNANPNGDGS